MGLGEGLGEQHQDLGQTLTTPDRVSAIHRGTIMKFQSRVAPHAVKRSEKKASSTRLARCKTDHWTIGAGQAMMHTNLLHGGTEDTEMAAGEHLDSLHSQIGSATVLGHVALKPPRTHEATTSSLDFCQRFKIYNVNSITWRTNY